ncbi:MAG: HD domain-containing protein [Verrucomicrobiales bacterium]
MELVGRAKIFATAAHAAVGQRRKYSGAPYIVHPVEVMEIVRSVPHTPEMLAAALLHDTVEDTKVTLDLIRSEFGDAVADLVGWLTDPSKPRDGNRAARKAVDRAHTAAAPAEAQTIKLADLIANTGSIVENDPAFAKIYLAEQRALLAVMERGDRSLHRHASELAGCLSG